MCIQLKCKEHKKTEFQPSCAHAITILQVVCTAINSQEYHDHSVTSGWGQCLPGLLSTLPESSEGDKRPAAAGVTHRGTVVLTKDTLVTSVTPEYSRHTLN